MKQVAQIFDNDELDEARRKLRAAVSDLVDGLEEAEAHAAHLAMLVGLEGSGEATDRETLFFSARVLVESLAARSPTMLLFEDIHWADASLLDLIEMLAARVRDVPLLLVALSRPELLTDRPTWGGGLPAYTALQLERLSEDNAQALAELLLDRAGASPDQADVVAGPPRATRSSSRSWRRRWSSARPSTRGCRRACAPSSRPGSTRCPPPNAPSSSMQRS